MPLNGITYTVGIATREAMDGIAGTGEDGDERAEGVTAPALAIIAIADDVPDERRPAVFWHEVMHAAFGEVGVGVYASLVLCKDEDARRSQENLCSFIGPLLASTQDGPRAIAKALAGPVGKRRVQSERRGHSRKARAKGRGKRATRR